MMDSPWRTGICLLGGCCLWGGLWGSAQAAGYEESYAAAMAAMERRDFVAAEHLFAAAKEQAPEGEADFARTADAKRAALYIRAGEYDRAVNILRPYVEGGEDDSFMRSDYLMALWLDKKPKEAEQVFRTRCADWEQMPSYGLQAMGDMYLRAGKYRKAHEIYACLNRREDMKFVRLGDAYALAMLGRGGQAAEAYGDAVRRWPETEDLVAGDADAFLQQGKLHLARRLYALLGRTAAERERFALRYAQSLLSRGGTVEDPVQSFRRAERLAERSYLYEAQRVYRGLLASEDEDTRTAAQAGLAGIYLQQGRYAAAERRLAAALAADPGHPEAMAAAGDNDRRIERELAASVGTQVDSKRNRDTAVGMDFRQYLGGDVFAVGGIGWHRLQDGRLRAHYRREGAGLLYPFSHGEARAEFDRFAGGFGSNGYEAELAYAPGDFTRLAASFGRRPHGAAGAVREGIREDFVSLRWRQVLDARWALGAGYERAHLDDGNDFSGYDASLLYHVSARHNYRDDLLMEYAHGHYAEESFWYDSPGRRVDYGIGWSRKWALPRRRTSWEWLAMLSWGRDDDERTEFSPYMRLEWGRDVGGGQRLAIGAEYHWHTHPQEGEGRRRSGYLLDMDYYIGW